MGWRKRKRSAWAAGVSLVLHVLMLTGMVLGLRVVTPPPEERAMEVSLLPLPVPVPAVRVPPRAVSAPSRPGPPARPRIAPLPAAPVPGVVLPEAKAAPAPEPRTYGPVLSEGGLKPSLSGRVGCGEDPLTGHPLTETQKQVCADNLAALAKGAKPLGFAMAAGKEGGFDRDVGCHKAYAGQGIPNSSAPSDIGIRSNVGNRMPTGLGYAPKPKDCGFGQR